MKKRIFQICLIIYCIISNFSLAAQTNIRSERIPEFDNYEKREDWFRQVRFDSTVQNPEIVRWNAFLQMQENLLRETDEIPVANWRSCGPVNQGGRMISHAFDPVNSDIIWAGAASGGLWKTINSGDSWEPMTDGIPSLAIGAIGINPQNNNEMLIGTGEGFLLAGFLYGVGVLKSSDGGLTWQNTGLTFDQSLEFASLGIAWDSVETNYVYLATTFGIYRSTDSGENWELTLAGTGTSIVLNPQQPEIVFAALQEYGGNTGGIYRSTDHGANWELLINGLPATNEFGFTSMSICKDFPDVIVAGVANNIASGAVGTLQGIYKTSNGGDAWNLLPESIDFYCYPAPYDYLCQGWYDNIIKISPTDTNVIFAGGIYLYKSADGGITWDFSDDVPGIEGYIHPDHHSFGFDPQNESRIFSFNDGGIYRTENSGTTWTQINNGLVTTQFYNIASARTNKNVVMGGTQDNGIWFNDANDVQQVWEQYTYGDGFQCAIDHTNENVMYATELFQGRMKSTNGGHSFHGINTGINENNSFIMPLIMHPVNNEILFTATDTKIYKTENSGEEWNDVDNISNIIFFCFDGIDPDIMYACTDPYFATSKIYISVDGGESWDRTDEPGNKITDIEADPNIAGTIYATRATYQNGSQVWKSIDYGETWENITGDLPAIPANTIAIDPRNSNYLYVGTDIGVFISTIGGETWTSFNDNLPTVIVKDLLYSVADTSLRAGTHGRGFWQTPAAKMVVEDTIPAVENSIPIAIGIYPNPFIGESTISFSIADYCDVQLSVVDQLGQTIKVLLDEVLPPGQYSVNWNSKNENGHDVAAGVYYIRWNYCGKGRSLKVVVQ